MGNPSMDNLDFDINVLRAWLEQQTGETGAIQVTPIRGGGSCEMFELKRDTERWAIRRAPVCAVSDTAHNVVREYQVIDALQGSTARVPELLAVCDDIAIIGAPFYIMKYVDGEVIRRKLPRQYIDKPETQGAIGEELIDALSELHELDWRTSSMVELAKPDNFLARQVDRWRSQLESYRSRELTGVDEVAKWLQANRPVSGDLTIMHGDYKVDNAIYSKTLPPRILTLVDFEMTTVGDPLIDLAWAMIFWPEPENLIAIAAPGSDGGMSADYCQRPATLVQRYADKTGRDLSCFQWYQAFAAWKLGIVLEASYAKYTSGVSKNPNHEFFGYLVEQLMLRAQRFALA
jgi:aminoglycoside phosphotransferase (APT) family kinase protein